MNLHDALLSRRTIYHYTDEPIPDEAMERALNAAIWAPCHKLTEPWRFCRVGPETRAKLGDINAMLAEEKAKKKGEVVQDAVERARKKMTHLPALLVVSMVKSPDDAFREREDYAATCCAIQNLALSLWADGIGAQWSTGGVTRHPDSYSALGIDPGVEEIVGFIKIGYARKTPKVGRRPLNEVKREVP
jgi:nitroreductase